ncbi:MAG: excinuclease ABC subunit UvrA [Pedosphaera sp.]|nr:excinuclease ABC subunit UvrA [Pedosphaera sp.]
MPSAKSRSLPQCIRLRGVRQNNLKGFDLDLPLGELIVITGLSGSGKSSLAFDTLYAEGQRRYIETFTPYARQFFDRMDKPAVDSIENIPPAIAIEQRNAVRSTRSTVGTMTEICEYMKQVWTHVATLYCDGCGNPVRPESPMDVWNSESASNREDRRREALITFGLALSAKMGLEDQLQLIAGQGFQRVLVESRVRRIDEIAGLVAAGTDRIEVVADRIGLGANSRKRFVEACEQAYHFGHGRLTVWELGAGGTTCDPRHYSQEFHCARCDRGYAKPSPPLFSFNNPVGACPACKGFGRIITIDPNLAIPDRSLTLAQGAVKPWQSGVSADCQKDMARAAKRRRMPMDVPFEQLTSAQQSWVMEGDPGHGLDADHQWPKSWYGVMGYFKWLESKAYKMHVRVLLSRYRSYRKCHECGGRRFNPDALRFRITSTDPGPATSPSGGQPGGSITLADFYSLPVRDALGWVERMCGLCPAKNGDPRATVLAEVKTRLGYLNQIGLGYLTLDRPTRTLSGGETERVNLTTCLGTRLVNTLFVLDEPSVGLHPRDTDRLVALLARLRSAGNTLVVVEHEPGVMRAADRLIDLGPGHGETGGHVMFNGPASMLESAKNSLTADYLLGRRPMELTSRRPVPPRSRVTDRSGDRLVLNDAPAPSPERHLETRMKWLHVERANANNLKDLSVDIPLGRFVCVTGVSGSGKTTLIRDVLLPCLQAEAMGEDDEAEAGDDAGVGERVRGERVEADGAARITGRENIGRVVLVDQSALGRTPRSNPAVYLGAFEDIRNFFAASEIARELGLNSSAFSFNSAQGQCERCRGAGFEKIEMQFLSDVFVRCPECNGRRYRKHILEVRIVPGAVFGESDGAGKSIADLLEASVDEAIVFLSRFADSKPAGRAVRRLQWLVDVGLGYLRLGQPINTLSGGESQRLKLASHLSEAEAAVHAKESRVRWRGAKVSDAWSEGEKPALFLFDEPTTGLHFEDVRILVAVFQRLVDAGNSVLVIEHNLELIRCADWIVDLGPEAGDKGGELVVCGPPEEVAACENGHTGRFLRAVLAPIGG